MKCLLVVTIALVVLVAADDEWKPIVDMNIMDRIHQICFKEHPLSEEQFSRLRNYEFPDESGVQELMLCLVKRAGLFSEESGFYAERFVAQFAAMNITSEGARSSIVKCAESVADLENVSAAARAYRGLTCILNSNRETLEKMNKGRI